MIFRKLTVKEEETFRDWARKNYIPFSDIKGIWHPVCQEECIKINKENTSYSFTGPLYATEK